MVALIFFLLNLAASWAPCTVNLLGAVTKGGPVSLAISAAAASANPERRVDARSNSRPAKCEAVHAVAVDLERLVEIALRQQHVADLVQAKSQLAA